MRPDARAAKGGTQRGIMDCNDGRQAALIVTAAPDALVFVESGKGGGFPGDVADLDRGMAARPLEGSRLLNMQHGIPPEHPSALNLGRFSDF